MLVLHAFPPTFNRLLDFTVLPLDLVHRLVLLLLLLPLPLFELLLLPLLSVSLLPLVLVGVLCEREEERILHQDKQIDGHIYSHTPFTRQFPFYVSLTPRLNCLQALHLEFHPELSLYLASLLPTISGLLCLRCKNFI